MKKIILGLLSLTLFGCGDDGKNGQTGEQGLPGKSCTVKRTEEGAVILCPDGSAVLVKDGKNCKKDSD